MPVLIVNILQNIPSAEYGFFLRKKGNQKRIAAECQQTGSSGQQIMQREGAPVFSGRTAGRIPDNARRTFPLRLQNGG